MARYPEADILTSSDHLVCLCTRCFKFKQGPAAYGCAEYGCAECEGWCLQVNTTDDDGLERFPEAGSAANIGIMLFRKSAMGLAKVNGTQQRSMA
jgi:hypothetical protein